MTTKTPEKPATESNGGITIPALGGVRVKGNAALVVVAVVAALASGEGIGWLKGDGNAQRAVVEECRAKLDEHLREHKYDADIAKATKRIQDMYDERQKKGAPP